MNDPLIARFADACGATGPLLLRVDLAGGGLLAEGAVAQPFTLVGRDDSCDVTLSDPDINPRHAWLQVLGGRVYAVDLGSRTGLVWPGGVRGSGWLDPGTGAKLGPFLLRLGAPPADRNGTPPPDGNPLAADPGYKARAAVALEFRNGKRAKDRWAVNRLLTLIGRSPECKIHLNADDISPYHCGLVSTRSGLWVVDLSGRGVVVNGERMRVAPLPPGAELWVGRFLIGCHYPGPNGPADHTGAGPSARTPRLPLGPTPPPRLVPDDEVELGVEADGAADLPNSHIMADAFRAAAASGPASQVISLSGSGPPPAGAGGEAPIAGLLGALGIDPGAEGPAAPVLRQMADLHARAGDEFAQWLTLLSRLFGHVGREHLAAVQSELNRIEELTAEISALQGEVSRRAIARAVTARARETATDGVTAESWAARTSPGDTPPPQRPLPFPGPDGDADTLDRLHALQQDRAHRWQAVIALLAG